MAAKLMPSKTRTASSMAALVANPPATPLRTRTRTPVSRSARAPTRPPAIPVNTPKPAPNAKKMEASQPAATLSSANSSEISPIVGGTLPTA